MITETLYLLIQKLQQLLLCFFNIILWSTDEDLVTVTAFRRKLDAHTTTFVHDRTDQPALGTDHRIVMFMRDVYL